MPTTRRGRTLQCAGCKQKGATIGCFHPKCEAVLHFRCCIATGWNFDDPKQGKLFYCHNHRGGQGPNAALTQTSVGDNNNSNNNGMISNSQHTVTQSQQEARVSQNMSSSSPVWSGHTVSQVPLSQAPALPPLPTASVSDQLRLYKESTRYMLSVLDEVRKKTHASNPNVQ